jgi:hypothetical protein
VPEITPVPRAQVKPGGKLAASKAGFVTSVVTVNEKDEPTVADAVVALVIDLLTGVVKEVLYG